MGKSKEEPKQEHNKTHYLDELPNIDKEVVAKMFELAIPELKSINCSMEKIKLSAEYSIAELEAIITEAKKKSDWRSKLVQKGNNYLLISSVEIGCFKQILIPEPLSCRNSIHAFHTNQKNFAQLIADKCTLMLEMHQFAYHNNDGWVADYRNNKQYKFGVRHLNNKFIVDSVLHQNILVFGIAVKSKELAEQMLSEFGDRIKQLYNVQTA